jgi:tetratricopeptide (TPR) repeat protein
VLIHLQRPEDALLDLRRALSIGLDAERIEVQSDAHYRLGLALGPARAKEAVAAFESAISLKVDHAPAFRALAMALACINKLEDALDAFNAYLFLREADATVLVARAELLCKLKRFDEALADLDGALRLGLDPELKTLALTLRAMVHNARQRWDEALAELSQFARLQPENAKPRFLSGYVRMNMGDWQGALADLGESARLENSPVTLRFMAIAYKNLGRLDEALEAARRALELDDSLDNRLDCYHVLAVIHGARGENQDALHFWTLGTEAEPADELFHVGRGFALLLEDEFDEAVFEFETVLARSTEPMVQAVCLLGRGQCRAAQDETAAAIDDFRSSIELEPSRSAAHHELGACFLGLGMVDDAIDSFTRAIELDPRHGPSYTARATAYRHRADADAGDETAAELAARDEASAIALGDTGGVSALWHNELEPAPWEELDEWEEPDPWGHDEDGDDEQTDDGG